MTGEIAARHVLKVGGVKERCSAPPRGITTSTCPRTIRATSRKAVDVRTHVIFCPVERIEQVLQLALEPAQEESDVGNGAPPDTELRIVRPDETSEKKSGRPRQKAPDV